MRDAEEDSYLWVNLDWSLWMAFPTDPMSCIWNSLTAVLTLDLVRSGLKRANTRNMSSASCCYGDWIEMNKGVKE